MMRWPLFKQDKIDKIQILKRIPLFSNLKETDLRFLASESRLIEFKRGDFIYREGDPADCFYVVVSGRLKVFTVQGLTEKVFAYLYEGGHFGEVSLLTDEPHSVNVEVQNDAILLRLEREDFHKLLERSPHVAVEISRILGTRLKEKDRERTGERIKASKIVSVYSAAPQVGKTLFATNLAAGLAVETLKKTILIDFAGESKSALSLLGLERGKPLPLQKSEMAIEDIQKYVSVHPSGFHVLEFSLSDYEREGDEKQLSSLFSRLVFAYDFVVLVLPAKQTFSIQNILLQSDLVYLVTDGDQGHLQVTKLLLNTYFKLPKLRERLRLILNEVKEWYPFSPPDKELFLGSKISHILPYTPNLKTPTQEKGVPFIIAEPEARYSRLVRYMARETGEILVGLVLGSGAALGLAHLGVIKVLEKEKIPIDVVAGSSIGAIVAAALACGKSFEEMEKMVMGISTRRQTYALLGDFDFFWRTGFFRGTRVTQFLKDIFGNITFQETTIPLKVIAMNLTTREELVIDQGSLVNALRESMSIPGIFQPLIQKGQIVVDGAVASPVPIQCLRRMGIRKIIAVNVLPSPHAVLEKRKRLLEAEAKKEATIQKKNLFVRIGYRLRKRFSGFFSPNIFDIMMQSMQTMEYQISEVACQEADVVIRPTHISADWFEFFEAKKFVRHGEEEAIKHLDEIKALVFEKSP